MPASRAGSARSRTGPRGPARCASWSSSSPPTSRSRDAAGASGLPEHRHELVTDTLSADASCCRCRANGFLGRRTGRGTTCSPGSFPGSHPTTATGRRRRRLPRRRRGARARDLGHERRHEREAGVRADRGQALDDLHVRGLFLVGDESNITGPLQNRPGACGHSFLCTWCCRGVEQSFTRRRWARPPRCSSPGSPRWRYHSCSTRSGTRTAPRSWGPDWCIRNPCSRSARRLMQRLVTDEQLRENAGAGGSTRGRARHGHAPPTRSKPPSSAGHDRGSSRSVTAGVRRSRRGRMFWFRRRRLSGS